MSGRFRKIVFLLSIVALTAAIWIARFTSPNRYELDIYGGTPDAFWVFVIPVAVFGAAGAIVFSDRRWRVAGLGLSSAAVLSILWLPLLRGYWFVGENDPMTHLGYTIRILERGFVFDNLFYPGLHTASSAVVLIAGVEPRRALVLVAFSVFSSTILMLAVASRILSRRRGAGVAGAILGLFFVGLYPLTTNADPDPTQTAVAFAAVPLFLLLMKVRRGREIPVTLMLGVSLLALYAFHPQQAISFILFSAALLAVWRLLSDDEELFAPPVPSIAAAGVFTTLVITGYETFRGRLVNVVIALATDIDPGASTAGRSSSLSELGVSLPVVILKYTGKDIVVGVGVLAALVAWFRDRKTFIVPPYAYLAGLVPLGVLLGVFAASGQANIIMRYASVIGVLTVPLAAAGYCEFEWRASRPRAARVALAAILCLGLIAAIPIIHPSPYSERPGTHVSEGAVASYDTMFNYSDGESTYAQIRSDPIRYWDATRGFPLQGYPATIPAPAQGQTPDHFEGLQEAFDGSFYLPVTEADRRRDGELWEGVRYVLEDFERLDRRSDLHRIHDSERATFYYSNGENP